MLELHCCLLVFIHKQKIPLCARKVWCSHNAKISESVRDNLGRCQHMEKAQDGTESAGVIWTQWNVTVLQMWPLTCVSCQCDGQSHILSSPLHHPLSLLHCSVFHKTNCFTLSPCFTRRRKQVDVAAWNFYCQLVFWLCNCGTTAWKE